MNGFEMIPAAWIDEAVAAYNWRRDGRASELHALADIFGLASTMAHDMPVGRGSIRLERGQLILTQRFVHDRWGWEKGRLRRWFTKLEAAGRIRVQRTDCTATLVATLGRDRVPTLVTIVGYGTYGVLRPSHKPSLAPSYQPNPQIGIPHLHSESSLCSDSAAVPASEPAGPLAGSPLDADAGAEPEPASKAKTPRKVGSDRHSQFIAWWAREYPGHHEGHPYTGMALAGAKEGAAVKRLLKAFPDGKELVRVVLRAWSGERAWWAEKSCMLSGLELVAAEVAAAPAYVPSRNGHRSPDVPDDRSSWFIRPEADRTKP